MNKTFRLAVKYADEPENNKNVYVTLNGLARQVPLALSELVHTLLLNSTEYLYIHLVIDLVEYEVKML